MNDESPFLRSLVEQQEPPQWWALRSQLNGKFVTRDLTTDGEFLEWMGPVLTFWDRLDAEREAVACRESKPELMIEAVPLPATPPNFVHMRRHKDGEPIAVQFVVTCGDEVVQVELRPETLTASMPMLTIIQQMLEIAAMRLAHARVSPLRFITLGPIPAQIELRNHDGTSATEAA